MARRSRALFVVVAPVNLAFLEKRLAFAPLPTLTVRACAGSVTGLMEIVISLALENTGARAA
jgi:hypothetical protein